MTMLYDLCKTQSVLYICVCILGLFKLFMNAVFMTCNIALQDA